MQTRFSRKIFAPPVLACFLYCCLCFALSTTCNAQSDKVWVFGSHAGIDFNSGSPVALYTDMATTESAASVCDGNGALLFYTDGYYVWDKTHNRMLHGDSLIPFKLNNTSSSFSTAQGALIVPVLGSPSRYYIFSLSSQENGVNAGKLYYSLVDMNLQNGKGDVVVANRAIALDAGLTEKMTAVATADCAIWLITCSRDGGFRSYKITAGGVTTTPVVSATGMGLPIGKLCVAPGGRQLAATNLGSQADGNYTGAALFNFDPLSGIVSGRIDLLNTEGAYGVCFSPDGSKIYINTAARKILQYDAANTTAAGRLICTTASYTSLAAGPDNKIYFHELNNGTLAALGVITKPDLLSPACDFRSGALSLLPGTGISLGLPNITPRWLTDTVTTTRDTVFPCWKDSMQLLCNAGEREVYWNTGVTTRAITIGQGGTYTASYHKGCTYYREVFRVSAPTGAVLPLVRTQGSCKTPGRGMAWIERPGRAGLSAVQWFRGNNLLATGDTVRGLSPGVYGLSLRFGNACDTLIPVAIPDLGVNNSIVSDTLVCLADTLLVSAGVTGPGIRLSWLLSDGVQYNTASFRHSFATAGEARVLLVSEQGQCRDTVMRYIRVDAPARILGLDKSRSAVCAGAEVVFTPNVVTGDGISGYQWRIGREELQSADPGPLTYRAGESGTIAVVFTVTARTCPPVSLRDSIVVHALPVADLGPDTAICPGREVWVCGLVSGSAAGLRYDWSNGLHLPRIGISAPGSYELKVTDSNGCSATDAIVVGNNCHMDIPNAFTPNGDLVNDYFFPLKDLSGGVESFAMKIFNRWGQLVFAVNGTDGPGWDGKFKNQEQPAGVYVYMIDVKIRERVPEQFTGNVTLLR